MRTAPATTAPATLHWRTLGSLFLAAGLVVLLTLAMGVDDSFAVPALVVMGLGVSATGLVFLAAAPRLPHRGLSVALLVAIAGVSGTVIASGEADTPFALFYIWNAVEAWYILRPRAAAAFTVVTLLVSAATMAAISSPEDNFLTWWFVLAATTVTVATLAAVLRSRVDRLVGGLAEAALRDPLTGLLNRRGFQEEAGLEMERARRYGAPMAVVVADLDHFKALNDAFGHHIGDEALAAFASLCRDATRSFDLVARMGGEEFAFLLPSTDEDGAIATAERIRAAMHDQLASPDGGAVTASFGVAAHPEHGSDLGTLLARADAALYAAKSDGRDRVNVFDGGVHCSAGG